MEAPGRIKTNATPIEAFSPPPPQPHSLQQPNVINSTSSLTLLRSLHTYCRIQSENNCKRAKQSFKEGDHINDRQSFQVEWKRRNEFSAISSVSSRRTVPSWLGLIGNSQNFSELQTVLRYSGKVMLGLSSRRGPRWIFILIRGKAMFLY